MEKQLNGPEVVGVIMVPLKNHPLKYDILKRHRIPHCTDNFYPI